MECLQLGCILEVFVRRVSALEQRGAEQREREVRGAKVAGRPCGRIPNGQSMKAGRCLDKRRSTHTTYWPGVPLPPYRLLAYITNTNGQLFAYTITLNTSLAGLLLKRNIIINRVLGIIWEDLSGLTTLSMV